MIVEFDRISPSTPGSYKDPLGHSPPLQAEGQVGLLLADHVVVAPVFSFHGRVVRVQVEATELELALADLSVPLVGRHLRELEALGPEGVHLVAKVGKVAL